MESKAKSIPTENSSQEKKTQEPNFNSTADINSQNDESIIYFLNSI